MLGQVHIFCPELIENNHLFLRTMSPHTLPRDATFQEDPNDTLKLLTIENYLCRTTGTPLTWGNTL